MKLLKHWLANRSFFIGNQETFQTNSSVHNINTRNKHHLHRPVANLSCFQRGASYSGIRIFNSLPQSITNLKNEKTQFKVALKKFLNAYCFYSVGELFTCTNDMYHWLYDCVNVSYTVILLLFVCLWLSRIYGMNICTYVWSIVLTASCQWAAAWEAVVELVLDLVIVIVAHGDAGGRGGVKGKLANGVGSQ